ncbi:MAG TPA: hypothetical protein VEA15_11240, partial [Caulobacteraceae bacterium]|nr:hypothetical protein [Caulobacteraceae bacterium]
MEWIARAVGAFYLVGGLFGLRAAWTNDLLDRVLAGLEMKATSGPERLRSAGLWVGGAMTAAGGLALLLLSRWAVWLFLANLLLQALYLAAASAWLKPEDEHEALGRRRTVNAALFWT